MQLHPANSDFVGTDVEQAPETDGADTLETFGKFAHSRKTIPVPSVARSATASNTQRRMRVIIPTTARPVELRAIKRRPRVPASYMAVAGDFRPLALSGDYHRFVNGPLRQVVPDLPSVELSLDDDLDCGRSWELPVLIAHLLEASGRAEEDKPDLLWATGMVDADLNPQSANYHLLTKLELSRDLFAENLQRGGKAVMVIPPPVSEDERQAVERYAGEYGIALTIAASAAEVFSAFGLSFEPEESEVPPRHDEADKAQTSETLLSTADGAATLPPQPTSPRKPLVALAAGAVVVTGIAVAGFVLFSSEPSTSPDERGQPERGPALAGSRLAVDGLYAENRAACQETIYTGGQFAVEPATQGAGSLSLAARDGLCGLRLRNISDTAQTLFVDTRLASRAIPGSASILSGGELSAGEATVLYFARPPTPVSANAVLRDPGGTESSITIEID
ncbi:hypothetical protein [Jiella marina]|uniref:hypothetical protein n=1 Tax=Jiella sp. LLJ827 TaxID=2917712 RepID=UPI002101A650|nr:hypothetical protein [Jiella sp. LLJ827]MCQ0986717.1 hypothetical protein [Jiella sp. LLJ827]